MHDRLPGAMEENFVGLAERLHQLCNGAVVHYLPNHGNWGDALIRRGTLAFFRDAEIEVKEHFYVKWRAPRMLRKPPWLKSVKDREGVLIYGGGGAWCREWDISGYVRAVSRYFRHTIILPSTFAIRPQLESATYYCRDRFESQTLLEEACFCDDMAFYLGLQRGSRGQGEAKMFRTDRESSGLINIPADNRDLSLEGKYRDRYTGFFDAISPFETVHTDRLHVAIAACLLGKKLHLYAGSYFKNQAVYLSSIKDVFPNVTFHKQWTGDSG